MNAFTLVLIIIGSFFFVAMMTTLLIIYLYFRDFVYILPSTGGMSFKIHRAYVLKKGREFDVKGSHYIFNEKCVFNSNGRKGIFVKEGVPKALEPKFNDVTLNWEFLSDKSIVAIINDKHVEIVAKAGQSGMTTRDILMVIGMFAILFFVILTFAKVFGIIKSKDVSQLKPTA